VAPFVTPLAGPTAEVTDCPRAGVTTDAANATNRKKLCFLHIPTSTSIVLHERSQKRLHGFGRKMLATGHCCCSGVETPLVSFGQMETILAWDGKSHGGKMPEGYLHLTCEQRCQIYALLQSGHSQAHTASSLASQRQKIQQAERQEFGVRVDSEPRRHRSACAKRSDDSRANTAIELITPRKAGRIPSSMCAGAPILVPRTGACR
jgi:hypothetical protein